MGSGLRTTCTGFFHIERPEGAARTWLIDPAGNPFWAVGLNTVFRTANANGIEAYMRRTGDPDEAARVEWDRLSTGEGGGFGYGFNNVGGFSDLHDLDRSRPNPITAVAPYGVVLGEAPSASDSFVLRSGGGRVLGAEDSSHVVGDPYNPAFALWLEEQWAPRMHPGDPRLMYYWIGNETGLFDHPLHERGGGVRDMRQWIWSECPAGSSLDAPACSTHALGRQLRDRHGTIGALNAAWGSSYASFEALLEARPQPGLSGSRACGTECSADLQRFVRALLLAWIDVTTTTVRRLDPDHLVSAPRLHVANGDAFCWWGIEGCAETFLDGSPVPSDFAPWDLFGRRGEAGFDLVSVNIYSRPDRAGFDRPWVTHGIHRIQRESGLPILISEIGVRSRISGWNNRGGAPAFVPRGTSTEQQRDRGRFYRTDLDQLLAFSGILGVSYHRWADRYLPESQMNMGIIHRNGERWDYFDTALRDYHDGIYSRLRETTGW